MFLIFAKATVPKHFKLSCKNPVISEKMCWMETLLSTKLLNKTIAVSHLNTGVVKRSLSSRQTFLSFSCYFIRKNILLWGISNLVPCNQVFLKCFHILLKAPSATRMFSIIKLSCEEQKWYVIFFIWFKVQITLKSVIYLNVGTLRRISINICELVRIKSDSRLK